MFILVHIVVAGLLALFVALVANRLLSDPGIKEIINIGLFFAFLIYVIQLLGWL